jgi:hypothetical protein
VEEELEKKEGCVEARFSGAGGKIQVIMAKFR